MTGALIALIVLIIVLAALVYLQIVLSKKNNKWLGLILPSLTFVYSIITAFSYSFFTTSTSVITNSDGEIISETTSISESPTLIEAIGTIAPVFIVSNIPTMILLLIYFANRKKLIQREQLNRMTIQDLE